MVVMNKTDLIKDSVKKFTSIEVHRFCHYTCTCIYTMNIAFNDISTKILGIDNRTPLSAGSHARPVMVWSLS